MKIKGNLSVIQKFTPHIFPKPWKMWASTFKKDLHYSSFNLILTIIRLGCIYKLFFEQKYTSIAIKYKNSINFSFSPSQSYQEKIKVISCEMKIILIIVWLIYYEMVTKLIITFSTKFQIMWDFYYWKLEIRNISMIPYFPSNLKWVVCNNK